MYRAIREITDRDHWEAFIFAHQSMSLFQSWDWGQLQKHLGNQVNRWGLYTDKELIGIAQLVVVKAKRGIFVHVRHGPIFRVSSKNLKVEWRYFSDEIVNYGKSVGAWFVRVSPLIENTSANETLLQELGYRTAPIPRLDG